MIKKYFPDQIEPKWQEIWKKEGINKFDKNKVDEKYYNLVELPYPSGDLHIGHWFSFVYADAHARYKKMTGKNVFFPNGFDAFGLPAENAAIKNGVHPQDWTMKNIENMRKQFDLMGSIIDWDYTAITCLPEYYRWNQWIFLKMFEKGIAYRGKALSNWCPVDQTVLANEHIEGGKCWRCGSEVIQKEVEQWFLKITDYADRLIWKEDAPRDSYFSDDAGSGSALRSASDQQSEDVDWPKQVREGQNNWIGRSEGKLLKFKIVRKDYEISKNDNFITVFTTRPDTTDGATFLVIAPEHPIAAKISEKSISEYIKQAQKKTEMERKEDRVKSGVFTGICVQNPENGKEIPVWMSDYVLAGYGTGAIMAVPFADSRDKEFAEKFNLPVIETTFKANPEGEKSVNYHLRDWSISRQRYWGTPIPIIYCKHCARGPVRSFPPASAPHSQSSEMRAVGNPSSSATPPGITTIDGEEYAMVPVSIKDLPVKLPYNVDYAPKGKPPLATDEEWLKVKCPKCQGSAKRDAETLDTFFDSSWYFYRYVSPEFDKAPFDKDLAAKLLPVDIYFGGAEHTLGHTLYARFFTRFFKELGLINFDEFALKRAQHGVILGPDGNRMSKSKGNVVNPEEVVKEYGADAVRLYLSFMMPFEATAPWSTSAIAGIYRFLRRVWDLQDKVDNTDITKEDLFIMHKSIKKIGEDLDSLQLNTAVAQLMTWLNHLEKKQNVSINEYEKFLIVLAPFAPHITEELWQSINRTAKVQPHAARDARQDYIKAPKMPPSLSESRLQNSKDNQNRQEPSFGSLADGLSFSSIHLENWPQFEEKYLVEDEISIVVQINGKLRDTVRVKSSELKVQSSIEDKAKQSDKIKKYLEGSSIRKVIYIEGKLLNFVV